jgi:FADH2 O2-dependent halogenase
MDADFDIAIVGSGFAGALMAMVARRLGRSVVIVDKGRHPRFAIGESSTPLTNLMLEELATRYDMPGVRPLAQWGTWQRTYPEIGCGLKRGFTFYHHDPDRPATDRPGRDSQLLVAASPNEEIADTHWYRADFDHLLARQAEEMGAELLEGTELTSLAESAGKIALEGRRDGGRRDGRSLKLSAKFLLDASGPRGFLHRALRLGESELPDYPRTQALYSHFVGVERLERTRFGSNDEPPPYPIDAAAVHHVIGSGGGAWIWVLRFNNGVTSAGIAATDALAKEWNLAAGAEAWPRILSAIPALREQFAEACACQPFVHVPRLSYCSARQTGDRWALLPSTAGFVDPLLSTGFPLALLGIARLGELLETGWNSGDMRAGLDAYARRTRADLHAVARLIAALYANMGDFPVFSALLMIYFAAASYSETARRLGKPSLAADFLLHSDPAFGTAVEGLLVRARQPRSAADSARLAEDILRTIAPFNVAGLGESNRRNWYPVDAMVLFRSASKLGADRGEIAAMLERCGIEVPKGVAAESTQAMAGA